MEEKKTGYEWCLIDKIRLRELAQWPTGMTFFADSYFNEKIIREDFNYRINLCDVVKNSMPRKTEMFLEYRMYGLVPYNLSPIQQGIQYGHAVVEYQQMVKSLPSSETVYDKWAKVDKTFIILNGGTTNENPDRLGTLQQHCQTLKDNGILVSEFREPDLNDTLTAVDFLVDERVFNRELYPDFVFNISNMDIRDNGYDKWVEKIGGPKNAFLRNFLLNFKLA